MKFRQWPLPAYVVFVIGLTLVYFGASGIQAYPRFGEPQPGSAAVEFMTVEELKSKIAKNEPVTIIDVRSTSSYTASDVKIKGAIHVKLRRLKDRLTFAPLKNVPRNSEVITYCACPSDEASVRAAQVLLVAGFKRVRVLKGGWQEWQRVRGQVELRPKVP